MKTVGNRNMGYSQNRPLIALITGATGFIGSHLTRQLVKNGWKVHIITRPDSKLHLLDGILESLMVHEHDGSTERMIAILENVHPDIVFHLAAFSRTTHQPKDLEEMLNSNIVFGTQLVEAMINSGVYHLINTSTCLQHFENKNYNPACLYAATKQAFEDILTYYTETTPLQVVTLKLFNCYGPHDPRARILSLLQKAAKENTSISLSPGEQFLDLVYIDDISEAYMSAAELLLRQPYKNEVYSISSQNPIRLKDLVRVFEAVTGSNLQIIWGGRPYNIREAMIPWNIGKSLPNWEPKITLEEGIQRLVSEREERPQ
jgi:nucleoside-diphosphate-sugar epimerase